MTSKRTSSLLPACCSANSASVGDSMATALSSYGELSYLSSPRQARASWPDATRFVSFNPTQYHRAIALLSGPLPIAEMSSTVRCAVTANRLSRACSCRSV